MFDPAVGAGTFAAEYTFGTVCTATGTVAVNVGEAVAASLEDLAYCESIGSVQLDDDGLAGSWSADCGGCVQTSGTFTPPGPGTYVVSFMPGAGCGVESSATVTVDESLPIGSANVPEEMCVNAGILNLVADVDGGTWSSSGTGLNGAAFNPATAPLGTSVLSYTVENGLHQQRVLRHRGPAHSVGDPGGGGPFLRQQFRGRIECHGGPRRRGGVERCARPRLVCGLWRLHQWQWGLRPG